MNKTIWWDLTNVPHVNFLLPFIHQFSERFNHQFSIRDFAETKSLFEKRIGEEYLLVGKHKGEHKVKKVIGVFERAVGLHRKLSQFDIKISVGGDASGMVAKWRGKKSITFDDNEKAPNWRYSRFTDFAFWPKAIATEVILRQGFKTNKLYQYNGFKEDVYLADYKPDESFLSLLPFSDYVVVRPENIQANYVKGNNLSIVPKLLEQLDNKGVNVLFLPRYEQDKIYAKGKRNIFIPDTAINGMDACYYSNAVLTGAGTMAREAACLGVPAFSFYAGKKLLTVDQKMISDGWMFFSRDPSVLIERFLKSSKKEPDLARCMLVQQEVKSKLEEVVSKFTAQ
jgi:hypothetical protein